MIMKHSAAVTILFGAVFFGTPLFGQGASGLVLSFDQSSSTNLLLPKPKLSVPLVALAASPNQTVVVPLMNSSNELMIFRVPSAHSATIVAPGIYKTEPYTCLVLVPGRHLDDKSIISGNRGPQIQMPTVRPDLKLIPRKPSSR